MLAGGLPGDAEYAFADDAAIDAHGASDPEGGLAFGFVIDAAGASGPHLVAAFDAVIDPEGAPIPDGVAASVADAVVPRPPVAAPSPLAGARMPPIPSESDTAMGAPARTAIVPPRAYAPDPLSNPASAQPTAIACNLRIASPPMCADYILRSIDTQHQNNPYSITFFVYQTPTLGSRMRASRRRFLRYDKRNDMIMNARATAYKKRGPPALPLDDDIMCAFHDVDIMCAFQYHGLPTPFLDPSGMAEERAAR